MKRSYRSASIGVAMTLVLGMFGVLSFGCGTIDASGLLGLDACDILNCDGLLFRNLADDHGDTDATDGVDDHDDDDDGHMGDMDDHDDDGDDHMDGVDDHDDDGDDDHMDDMGADDDGDDHMDDLDGHDDVDDV